MKIQWSTFWAALIAAVAAYLIIEFVVRPLMAQMFPEKFEA